MDANGDVYEPCTIEASYFFEVRVESGSAVDNFELGVLPVERRIPSTDRAVCFLRTELSLCNFGRLKISKLPAEMD